ncbi:MAG: 5-(carboxyamino)imidazole ribonucleotide synthase [Bacteroidia bacterium]|nr:5-(carboxyamino)imidazole ribonucleotide synthase [Bacteroidia bacterium]
MKPFYRGLRLGIVGGGQLGRMMIQAAVDFNVHIRILDPSGEAPAKAYAHEFVRGSLTDYDTVLAFGREAEVITIEIENVNTEALEQLQAEGKTVFPDPKILRLIQDKRKQKEFFRDNGLPTAPFIRVENRGDIIKNKHLLPAVNKTAVAGYDGRGVQVLRSAEDLLQAFDTPGLLESYVSFEKEIAVIVARNPQGEIRIFPAVEMVFHPIHNLVEYLFAPAEISESLTKRAGEIAVSVVQKLRYVGVMAIEMFVTASGEILINELAPRPHNSGHHTIRACLTSQYEQHLRAILSLPLGPVEQFCPAAMVNLLGESGYSGPAVYEGIEEILAMEGVYPHIYGKAETQPQRKMGHVTILGKDKTELTEKISYIRQAVRVVSGGL